MAEKPKPKTSPKPKAKPDMDQSARFIETARELGVEDGGADRFKAVIDLILPHKGASNQK